MKRHSELTKRDLETLSRVVGFVSVEEFSLFLLQQDTPQEVAS